MAEVCVKAVRQPARSSHRRIELGGTAISVASSSAVATGEIRIADCLVDAGRFGISGNVGAKDSDCVIHARLIEQQVTEIVEQTLRRRGGIGLSLVLIFDQRSIDAFRANEL